MLLWMLLCLDMSASCLDFTIMSAMSALCSLQVCKLPPFSTHRRLPVLEPSSSCKACLPSCFIQTALLIRQLASAHPQLLIDASGCLPGHPADP